MGKKGSVKILVKLSTPEGNFNREREVGLDESETSSVDIQFPEPTIASSLDNVQASIQCQ